MQGVSISTNNSYHPLLILFADEDLVAIVGVHECQGDRWDEGGLIHHHLHRQDGSASAWRYPEISRGQRNSMDIVQCIYNAFTCTNVFYQYICYWSASFRSLAWIRIISASLSATLVYYIFPTYSTFPTTPYDTYCYNQQKESTKSI